MVRSIAEIYANSRSKATDSYGRFPHRYEAFEESRPESSPEPREPSYRAHLPEQRPPAEAEREMKDVLSWVKATDDKEVPGYCESKMEQLHRELEHRLYPERNVEHKRDDNLESGGTEL